MFSVGDQIIYGSMGVCRVTGIGLPDMPGAEQKCYVLEPAYVANSRVYAPVENNPVKMRRLLTRQEAAALIESLPDIKPFPPGREKQELYSTYRSAIKSANSLELARLLKTLYEKKRQLAPQNKNIPVAEKEYLDTAVKVLHGEIAIVLDIPLEEVEEYIQGRLQKGEGGAA